MVKLGQDVAAELGKSRLIVLKSRPLWRGFFIVQRASIDKVA